MHQITGNQGPDQCLYPLHAHAETVCSPISWWNSFGESLSRPRKMPFLSLCGHPWFARGVGSNLTISCARRRPKGTVEWATTEKAAAKGDPELLALAGTPAVVNALRDKYLREREVRTLG
jgi:hypothetical protein